MSNNDEQVYAAPKAELQDEHNMVLAPDIDLAARGTRLGAAILDFVIAILFFIPGVLLMYMMGGDFSGEDETQMIVDIYMYSAVFLLIFFVINGVMLYKHGQTIAKRLLNIRIVRADGSRVGAGRMFGLRIVLIQLLYQVPLVGFVFMLVNILFIFREDQRCVHDLIADTKVIEA